MADDGDGEESFQVVVTNGLLRAMVAPPIGASSDASTPSGTSGSSGVASSSRPASSGAPVAAKPPRPSPAMVAAAAEVVAADALDAAVERVEAKLPKAVVKGTAELPCVAERAATLACYKLYSRAMAFVTPGVFVRGTRTTGASRSRSRLSPSAFTAPGLPLRRVSVRAASSPTPLSMAATSARDLTVPARSGLLAINDEGGVHVQQRARPRRNRKSEGLRSMVRENVVTPANLIYPLFVHTEAENVPIPSMPGCVRHTVDSVVREVGEARALGVRSVILFPKIPEELKTNAADECYNPSGLVPTLVSTLKAKYPDVAVWTDVALDPYSDQGHDGMVSDDNRGDGGCGRIMNDETVEQLCRQALCQARAGADVVAPSDMMDGRIGAIRDALDAAGFTDVSIVSYTAKYASAFYGPFRDALDSAPRESSNAPRNKKTYQMDPANSREALIEAALDVAEGADMLMIKPGMPYLDIIRRLREATDLPLAAYHVSGEYAMMKAAAERGWLDERETVMESLLCFKRAGADAILTYYAKQAAEWMNE